MPFLISTFIVLYIFNLVGTTKPTYLTSRLKKAVKLHFLALILIQITLSTISIKKIRKAEKEIGTKNTFSSGKLGKDMNEHQTPELHPYVKLGHRTGDLLYT